MLRLAFTLAAAALLQVPAHAADIKTIDCVEKSVDAATRNLLLADVNANFKNLDSQTYSQPTIAGFRTAVGVCRTKYGWSEKAGQAAILYALFQLSNATVRQQAKTAKLDYAKLEARFMALSEIERADAMQDAVLSKLAETALAAAEMNADNAKVAGAVFGFLAVRSKSVVDFVAN